MVYNVVYKFILVQSRFSSWSGGPSSCPGREISVKCMSASMKTIKQLNLIDATCTILRGFQCRDKNSNDQGVTKCPSSVKMQYECPYWGRKLSI